MKKIFTIISLLVLVQIAFAQNENFQHNIHVGAGFSLAGAVFTDRVPDSLDMGINRIDSKIAKQFTYDYSFHPRWSVGFAYSNQRFLLEQSGYSLTVLDNVLSEGEHIMGKINRNNYAVRVLFHYFNKDELDMYISARNGITRWRMKIEEVDTENKFTKTSTIWFAPQLALGMRYYFIKDKIGLSLEAGVGSPHYLNAGLNFRF